VFEGLTHREVAERLGRSEGACRMLLLRARAALALELERLDDTA
jgi:DNA-directed RNA polymerase specialized sigma24 family protein